LVFGQRKYTASIFTTRNTCTCVNTPALCTLQRVPECLSFGITAVILGKIRLSALIDSGSLFSFVNEETTQMFLLFHRSSHNVRMAVVEELQKELSQNFSNHNDSCSESCQDSFFNEVFFLLLTQSLVRFSRHTHTKM